MLSVCVWYRMLCVCVWYRMLSVCVWYRMHYKQREREMRGGKMIRNGIGNCKIKIRVRRNKEMAAAADCQQIVAPCVACVALQVPQRQRQHVKISKLEILVRNVTNSYLISYLHTDLTLQTLNCAPNIIYE